MEDEDILDENNSDNSDQKDVQDDQVEQKEELSEDEQLTQMVILEVSNFVKRHFKLEKEYIEEEKQFLQHNDLKQANKVDYFDIKTYLFTAINNITELDTSIKDGFFGKIQNDVQTLYNLYNDFMTKNKIELTVFETRFISGVKVYQDLLKRFNQAKLDKSTYESQFKKLEGLIKTLETKGDDITQEERKELGMYRKKNADAVYNFSKAKEEVAVLFEEEKTLKQKLHDIFVPEFELLRTHMINQIKNIINIKSYYLDKALWYYAADSNTIIKFFHDADIKGDYSLKTFLTYGLKNVDLSKTRNKAYYDKLKTIIKVLD